MVDDFDDADRHAAMMRWLRGEPLRATDVVVSLDGFVEFARGDYNPDGLPTSVAAFRAQLSEFLARGGDAAAFYYALAAEIGDEAARLRHEREAALVYRGAREHAELLAARRLAIVKARDEAVRLGVPAAVSAYRAIARQVERELDRVEREAEQHDPLILKAARVAAAPTPTAQWTHHQIPAVGPSAPSRPDPAEVAARRRRIQALQPADVPVAGAIPGAFTDSHLHAIDREFLPRVSVVVHRLVHRQIGAAIERTAAEDFPLDRRMPAADRARFDADRRRWISGRANRLTFDLVRAFMPVWAANLTIERVREAIKRDRRRGPDWPAGPTTD
jgi:hypothetical protein